MQITRAGSQPSSKGPVEYFTGAVRVDPLFQVGDPARVSGGHVTFEPGARSAWHTHPRSARRLLLRLGSAGRRWRAGQSRKSGPAMSSGFRQG